MLHRNHKNTNFSVIKCDTLMSVETVCWQNASCQWEIWIYPSVHVCINEIGVWLIGMKSVELTLKTADHLYSSGISRASVIVMLNSTSVGFRVIASSNQPTAEGTTSSQTISSETKWLTAWWNLILSIPLMVCLYPLHWVWEHDLEYQFLKKHSGWSVIFICIFLFRNGPYIF